MQFIKGLRSFTKEEPFFAAVGLFLIMMTALGLFLPKEDGTDAGKYSEERRVETSRKIENIGTEMMSEAEKNPRAMQIIGLATGIVFVMGLLIDAVLILMVRGRVFKKIFGIEHPRVPWGAREVAKAFVVMFALDLVIYVCMALCMAVVGKDHVPPSLVLMSSVLIRNVLLGLYIVYLVKIKKKSSLNDVGLTRQKIGKNFIFGICCYLGFLPIYIGMMLVIAMVVKALGIEPPVQTVVQVLFEEKNQAMMFSFSVLVAVLGPFFEEMLFRGFLYSSALHFWRYAICKAWR